MSDIDTNKIANIIADIQQSQKNIEESEGKSKNLRLEFEDEEQYADDERDTVKALRDELDSYLDELIPETGETLCNFEY